MHILLTGGTGFIGQALVPALLKRDHQLTILSRQARAGQASCQFVQDLSSIPASTRIDALINLAGASLADKRWSTAYKAEIVNSRMATTSAVCALVERLEYQPDTLLSASAIGYYGHHGDEQLDEQSGATPGFAQDLCQRWEDLAQTLSPGLRVCLLRLGVVLGPDGGALQQMLLPYKAGVASWLGGGGQWLSWVHRDDVVRAVLHLLDDRSLQGPFNLTAPQPVTAREFCDHLRCHRRTWIKASLPAPIARLMLGEMADELLLNGQRVIPARLQAAGFEFRYPQLHDALVEIL